MYLPVWGMSQALGVFFYTGYQERFLLDWDKPLRSSTACGRAEADGEAARDGKGQVSNILTPSAMLCLADRYCTVI